MTEEAQVILNILNESNDANVLPRVSKKYIMYTNPETKKQEKYDLTPKEFSKLQKDIGEQVRAKINDRRLFLSDPNVPIDKRANRVNKILDEVGAKVRKDFKKQKGLGK